MSGAKFVLGVSLMSRGRVKLFVSENSTRYLNPEGTGSQSRRTRPEPVVRCALGGGSTNRVKFCTGEYPPGTVPAFRVGKFARTCHLNAPRLSIRLNEAAVERNS